MRMTPLGTYALLFTAMWLMLMVVAAVATFTTWLAARRAARREAVRLDQFGHAVMASLREDPPLCEVDSAAWLRGMKALEAAVHDEPLTPDDPRWRAGWDLSYRFGFDRDGTERGAA